MGVHTRCAAVSRIEEVSARIEAVNSRLETVTSPSCIPIEAVTARIDGLTSRIEAISCRIEAVNSLVEADNSWTRVERVTTRIETVTSQIEAVASMIEAFVPLTPAKQADPDPSEESREVVFTVSVEGFASKDTRAAASGDTDEPESDAKAPTPALRIRGFTPLEDLSRPPMSDTERVNDPVRLSYS